MAVSPSSCTPPAYPNPRTNTPRPHSNTHATRRNATQRCHCHARTNPALPEAERPRPKASSSSAPLQSPVSTAPPTPERYLPSSPSFRLQTRRRRRLFPRRWCWWLDQWRWVGGRVAGWCCCWDARRDGDRRQPPPAAAKGGPPLAPLEPAPPRLPPPPLTSDRTLGARHGRLVPPRCRHRQRHRVRPPSLPLLSLDLRAQARRR